MAVAQRLTSVLRPGDSLARLSGDEFVILCEDLDESSQVDELTLRFNAALARPFCLSSTVVNVTASVGVAVTGPACRAPEQLIRDADLAMYRTKRRRVGSHDVLDLPGLHLAGYQAGLAHNLPGAVERGECHVEYQPIVDTAAGQLAGVEALLRWTHPARGPVSPTVLVPFAEQSGQITELGQWVLEQACRDHHRWQRQPGPGIGISVNVSAHQLMGSGFTSTVGDILTSTSTDPGQVTLEITESVLVRDEQRALVVLSELKDIGVTLALDDFGTGYSSLGYLNTLPVDTIKIDQTFIATLTAEPRSQRIITAIIALAHSLGMNVISEGVETADQHRELTKLGSDSCQGFYFARPMPAEKLDAFIQHQDNRNASLEPERQRDPVHRAGRAHRIGDRPVSAAQPPAGVPPVSQDGPPVGPRRP